MPTPSRPPTGPAWRLRAAGLLDVPLLFELIMEGSQAGAFTDRHLAHTGSPRLLLDLLGRMAAQHFLPGRPRDEWQVIETPSGEALGFLQLCRPQADGQPWDLVLLAIAAAHRNRGLGTQLVAHLLASVPADRSLRVHCTKYARAMQHILKKERFLRRREGSALRLEQYRSRPTALPAAGDCVAK